MNAAQRLALLRRVFSGRFRVDAHLGSGGYADVYRVTNLNLDRPEALKVLTASNPDDPVFIDRFLHESKLAASLVHPSIVRVYDSGDAEGVLWFSMELVEGRTLGAELEAAGPFPERWVAQVALPLLEALAYSHERGVIHRDIKAENILLDGQGVPHLMDFGIAKSPRSLLKTQTGFVVGTPSYVAPEQARGLPIDGRADIYALSVMLYYLASGRFPFEAEDPLQTVVLRLTEDPAPLSGKRPGVDPDFEAIVMKGLARGVDHRWRSAAEMKEALERYLVGEVPEGLRAAVVAQPVADSATRAIALPPEEQAARTAARAAAAPSGRSLGLLVAAALVAAVAVGTGGALLLRPGRPTDLGPAAQAPRPQRTPATTAPPTVPAPEPATESPAPTAVALRIPRPTPDQAAEPAPVRRAVQKPVRIPSEDAVPAGLPESCLGVDVFVSFVVSPDGRVASPAVISREHGECAPFALEAAKEWRFEPAKDALGQPVASPRQGAAVRFGSPKI